MTEPVVDAGAAAHCRALQARFAELTTGLATSCTLDEDCVAIGSPDPFQSCHGSPYLGQTGGISVATSAYTAMPEAQRDELTALVSSWHATCELDDTLCREPGFTCQVDGVILEANCYQGVCSRRHESCLVPPDGGL